jgi:receptor protein-tyrosine kinase
MTSLIEKAAERLEQLRRAGVDAAPQQQTAASASASQTAAAEPPQPVPAPAITPAVPAAAVATAWPVLPNLPNVPTEAQRSTAKVVQLDLTALGVAGFVTPEMPRSTIASQFRVIKRPLLVNAAGRGASVVQAGNLIMVTSAMAGEGKTFNAINLAMSIAMEQDRRVLLVDADVARPSLSKVLGLPPGPGLLDLLVDDRTEMADAMLRTNVDKLTLLPSGTPHPRATELLASDAMTDLIKEMGRRYPDRIVIFDSPPLLLTTEARVLATHMGQIVMVVQAERTLQTQVKHALSTIEACPVKLMLLNQVRGGAQDAYGYGYGYGYGQGLAASSPKAVAQ